jgi:hypothetical protein
MAKIQPARTRSGKSDPLVWWDVLEDPPIGEFRTMPPPAPDGYEDGYWSMAQVVHLPMRRVAVQWKFKPGPNDQDRQRSMERAAMDLYQSLQSVFCNRDEPVTTRGGHAILPPDTSADRWIWESFHKWAQALRNDGGPR